MSHKSAKQKRKNKEFRKARKDMNNLCKFLLPIELPGPTLNGRKLLSNACKGAEYEWKKCFGHYNSCIRYNKQDLDLPIATYEDWQTRDNRYIYKY